MITLKNISRSFKNGTDIFYALDDISVEIPENKITIISGPSGSGKSTLLSILGLLQTPSSGEISFNYEVVDFAKSNQTRQIINENISYVFQEFNLIDDFSVRDNLSIVCDNNDTIEQILDSIGLKDKKSTPTKLLSGGEKQRLAIGRAFAKGGDYVLLDEPTGNLDSENGRIIFELLKKFSKNKTIIVVTHDLKLAYNYADFVILLDSGKISSSFTLTQNSFSLDFKESSIDAFMPYIDLVKYKTSEHQITLNAICDKKSKNYEVNSSNVLSVFDSIYSEFKDRSVEIIIIEDTNDNSTANSLSSITKSKSIFPLKYIIKYSLLLFKNKIWRNIASIILLVLNIIMIFVYTNLATFDYIGATKSAVIENNSHYAQTYHIETNAITNEDSRYFNGKPLHDKLQKANMNALPFISASSNLSYLNISLVVVDRPTYYRDTLVAVPSIDTITTTDFVASLMTEETPTIDVIPSLSDIRFDYSLTLGEVFECDYLEQDRYEFLLDPNFQNEKEELFTYDYSLGFVSKETFEKMKQTSEVYLPASNFFLSNQSGTKTYAERTLSYETYNSNNLIAGRAPANEFEVVISSAFYEANKIYRPELTTVEDCIDVQFNYKDLESSPNRDLYQSTLNLYDITHQIKVVGITDDTQSPVYITQSFMDKILAEEDYYLTGYFVNLDSELDKTSSIYKDNVFYRFSYLEPIVTMRNLVKSDFFYIVLGAIAIVLVSTITFLALTFIMNVKEKYKEIAILKSFGTAKKNTSSLFFILNIFIAIVSIVVGLLVSLVVLQAINQIFMSPTVFDINYSIIKVTPISVITVILITLIASLVSTFFALIKVNKIDVALALKMY